MMEFSFNKALDLGCPAAAGHCPSLPAQYWVYMVIVEPMLGHIIPEQTVPAAPVFTQPVVVNRQNGSHKKCIKTNISLINLF